VKYRSIKYLLFLGSLAVFCTVGYFLFPKTIVLGIGLGIIASLFFYFFALNYLANRNDQFKADAVEDDRVHLASVAAAQIKADGSFFTTPKPRWPGQAYFQQQLVYAFFILLFALIAGLQSTLYPYVGYGIFAIGLIVLINGLVQSFKIKPPKYEQVTFYKDHLVFLPQNKKVPYSKVDYMEYQLFTTSRADFYNYSLTIRYDGEDQAFSWVDYSPVTTFDPTIFLYLGFKSVSLGYNPVGSQTRQRYIFNPESAPKENIDPAKIKASAFDQNVMAYTALAVFLIAFFYYLWTLGVLQDGWASMREGYDVLTNR
jgi:hypothetical protein